MASSYFHAPLISSSLSTVGGHLRFRASCSAFTYLLLDERTPWIASSLSNVISASLGSCDVPPPLLLPFMLPSYLRRKETKFERYKQTRWVIVCSFVENNVLREIIREIYFQNLFFKGQSYFCKQNFVENYISIIFYKSGMLLLKRLLKNLYLCPTQASYHA